MEKDEMKLSVCIALVVVSIIFPQYMAAQCPPLKPQKRGKKELKAIPFSDQNNLPASKHQESFNDSIKNQQPVVTKRRRKKN